MFASVLAINAASLVLSFPVFAETLLLYARELLALLPGTSAILDSRFLDPKMPLLACAW